MAIWDYLQSLISNASEGKPAPANAMTPLPANLQAGNTSSGIMQKISGLLGGGNPMQQQNNAYVKGKVDEYMANQAAVKARAQQKGAQATMREMKKGQQTLQPPTTGTPGSGQTPPVSLQQMMSGGGGGKTGQ
jgi:hypothetical protein